MKTPCARRGFTLVEILVVVAVIAVLAALAFPALQRAQASAQSAQCQSRLRQLDLFFMQTVNDNDQTLPVAIYWTSVPAGHSFMGLARDAPLGNVRLCPAQVKYLPTGYTTNASTFAMNATIQDVLAPKYTPVKLSALAHPAQTMILCDGSADRPPTVDNGYPGYVEIMNGVYPQAVHGGRAHVVYLDGHQDSLTADQIPHTYTGHGNPGSLFWVSQ